MEDESDAKLIVDNFISKIDNWINLNGFKIKQTIDIEHVEDIIGITDFTEYKYEELVSMSYILVSYANHLQSANNTEQIMLNFCDSSISYIICDIEMEGDTKYLKSEEKHALKVKQSPLSIELNRLRNVCWARLTSISYKIEYVRKMADIILEIAKRRKYEN